MRFCFALLVSAYLSIAAFANVERGTPLPRKGLIGVATAADPKGLKVTRVIPGGAGEASGLKVDDIIVSLNGKKVSDPPSFVALVHDLNAGEKFRIQYIRDGKQAEANGTLIERPKQTEPDLDVIYDQVVSQGKRIRVIITKPKGDGKKGSVPKVPLAKV